MLYVFDVGYRGDWPTRGQANNVFLFLQLNTRLKNLHFEGYIEDIKFDGVPVGVWDFIDGENNLYGAKQR